MTHAAAGSEHDGNMPRAQGLRMPYEALPQVIQSWVASCIGSADVLAAHRGGMSPGVAVSLRTDSGRRVFLKAVSEETNEQTAALFRKEIVVLQALPSVAHRPALLHMHDDGHWVALMLEHVDGRYPNFTTGRDAAAVEKLVLAQTAELTPPPACAPELVETVRRWQDRWQQVQAQPEAYLPPWAAAAAPELDRRIRRLADRVPPTTLCHFDIRNDNLLVRPDGEAVIFDWGMARLGPAWVDLALVAAQQPTAHGKELLRRHLTARTLDGVADFLMAFGCSQSWNARQPPPPTLPTMADYCADDARRLLALAQHLVT